MIQKCGIPDSRAHPEAYRLKHPLSPHAAAHLEGVTIRMESITLPLSKNLVVEGAGGIMVPFDDRHYMLDLMERLGLPVLLVASSCLGTINHTLLTITVLRARKITIAGIVINHCRKGKTGLSERTNPAVIERISRVPVIGIVRHRQKDLKNLVRSLQ